MLTHTATVRGRAITWDHREVVQHGLNADRVELVTDREWQECDRVVAVLAKAGKESVRVDAGDGFFVPSALMEDAGPLRMCLLGYAGDSVRIVTAKEDAPLAVVESGEVAGMDPAPEQPDLWAQLMEEVRKATDGAKTAAQSATRAESDLRAAAERGDFDGEDGKTPVRGVDYWTAEDRKPIEDATLAATAAAGRADAAAATATEGEASRVAAEAERVNAETARSKAEQAREGAEAGRVEAEKVRVTADAERGERVDAAVQKADAATAEATEAAAKAIASATEADAAAKRADEAAKGASENVLVGTETATVVHVEDAWPTLLRECKVLGKSEQTVTTGKNLFDESQLLSAAYSNGKVFINRDFSVPQTLPYSIQMNTQGVVFKLACKTGMQLCLSYKRKQSKALTIITEYASEDDAYSVEKSIGNANFEREDVSYTCKGNGCVLAFVGAKWSGEDSANKTFTIEPGCIQLEKGATTTAYEPYTGGKPSPSPEYPQKITNLNKAELVITGKNLLDESLFQENTGNTNAPIFLAKGTYVLSVQNDTKWWETTSDKQTIFVHTFDTNEFVAGVGFTNLIQGKRSYGRLTINKDCNIKIYSYGGWAHKAVSKLQLEAGTEATTYEPHQSKSAPIDLKGNELCSLPNGVKDEVVIDAEGNVNLIKRVAKYVVPENVYAQDESNNFGVQLELNAVDDKYLHKQLCPANAPYNPSMNWMSVFKEGNSWANLQEFKQWFIGTEFYYGTKNPETIPLGKVELPALPEATSNIWNDGNIPANVYFQYLKDVNIAFSKLESKLTQAVVAAAANL